MRRYKATRRITKRDGRCGPIREDRCFLFWLNTDVWLNADAWWLNDGAFHRRFRHSWVVFLQFPECNLNLLEMLLRIRPQAGVILIEVGMPLFDSLSIGLFNGGFFGDTEGDA